MTGYVTSDIDSKYEGICNFGLHDRKVAYSDIGIHQQTKIVVFLQKSS
jgi:hypothetical protein